MVYYFASKHNMDNEILSPGIPFSRMMLEDSYTKRICVSQSVNGCLTAIDDFYKGDIVYIHICECDEKYVIQPATFQVPDACFTGELWITTDVKMELYMTIKIVDTISSRVGNIRNSVYAFCTVSDGTRDQRYHQESRSREDDILLDKIKKETFYKMQTLMEYQGIKL